ncbi:MAG: metallophosphoesterase [Clostridia bacterium]|nr:metallophosphoesterase [Clostridia bacterium]
MAVYAIADLHLSFGTDKPMDVFSGWTNYTERIRNNWQKLIGENDTVVIAGDVSWAMKLSETDADFRFIDSLNGHKIILKGNHDYWWSTKAKMDKYIAEKGFDSISILHNNYYLADGTALCGSRGWFYDAEADADMLILNREVGRLRMSIEPALRDGYDPVVFLHYPPIYNNTECGEILDVLKEYSIKKCFYGHIHGGNAAKKAFIGEKYGINFKLIACDYLGFTPLAIN